MNGLCLSIRDGVPRNNEEYAGDRSVRDGFRDRGHDGVIRNTDAVRGGITHAGHIAALDGIRQKSLLAGILVVRCRSDAVTN